jgi:hypothetical protein
MTASEYYTVASLNDDLVAWFRFEGDETERKQNDAPGSTNNIISENFGTHVPSGGKYGSGAYSFPGDSYAGLHFSDSDLPFGDLPRTISGWVKYDEACGYSDEAGDRQVMFGYGKMDTDWRGMFFGRDDTGKISLGLVSGNWLEFGYQDNLCETNTWYHLAITYDGDNFKAYIDGEATVCTGYGGGGGQVDFCNDPHNLLTYTNYARIGSRSSGRTMSGLIDEVMVFSRALTPNEISALYNASAGNYQYPFNADDVKGYLVESSARRPAQEGGT